MSDFTNRLTEEMQYQGLRKSDIAAVCSIPDSTVRSWFARDTMPAADTAVKLAKLFHVTVEYLITGEGTAPKKELFSAEEKEIQKRYQALPDHDKNMVISLINTAYLASTHLS